jgi:acyl-CoA reductase-like NAD-dependent aldehyde dehydrogenase
MNAQTRTGTIKSLTTHYVDGAFVESHGREVMDIINATRGEVIGRVTLGDAEDTRRAIAAAKRDGAATMKRITLELGGKSPTILLGDAPLDQAVPAALTMAFTNSGQACAAGTRLLVPKSRLDEVKQAIREAIPENRDTAYFVKPTVFVNVNNDMAIAQEEIVGPVLSVIAYDSDDDAIRIANSNTPGWAVSMGDTGSRRFSKPGPSSSPEEAHS